MGEWIINTCMIGVCDLEERISGVFHLGSDINFSAPQENIFHKDLLKRK